MTTSDWPGASPRTRHSEPKSAATTLRRPARIASSRSAGVSANDTASTGPPIASANPITAITRDVERRRHTRAIVAQRVATPWRARYALSVRFAQCLAFLLLLGGCVSAFPADALRTVDRSITVPALRDDPTAYLGRRVLVGGDILATRPMPGATEVELLTKLLDEQDRPRHGDASPGRVIVSTPQFLDPAVYAEGRRITVIGTVTGQEERKIGSCRIAIPWSPRWTCASGRERSPWRPAPRRGRATTTPWPYPYRHVPRSGRVALLVVAAAWVRWTETSYFPTMTDENVARVRMPIAATRCTSAAVTFADCAL